MPRQRSSEAVKPLNLPDLSGLTLLVVDDDLDSVEMLSSFLKACGANVLEARSAAGALAYVDAAPRLDAVVTDLAMPQVDGIELVRKLRAYPERRDLPVIALTGFYEDYAGAEGFEAFLRKPVNFDQLCSAIAELVGRRSNRGPRGNA